MQGSDNITHYFGGSEKKAENYLPFSRIGILAPPFLHEISHPPPQMSCSEKECRRDRENEQSAKNVTFSGRFLTFRGNRSVFMQQADFKLTCTKTSRLTSAGPHTDFGSKEDVWLSRDRSSNTGVLVFVPFFGSQNILVG